MLAYLLRRFLLAIPTLVLITVVVFALITASGDPLRSLRTRPNVSRVTIEKLEQEFHLEEPILQRYGSWLNDVLHGRLGTSYVSREPVAGKIWRSMGPTLQLLVGWLMVSVLFGVGIGVYSALHPYSLADHTLTGISFVAYAAPVFLWAILLQHYLAVWLPSATGLKLFYVSGQYSTGMSGNIPNRLGHIALPVITLSIITVAEWSRFQRSSMLDVVGADYIRTAYAKGLRRRTVILRHALRNALLPLLTLLALDVGLFLGGAIVAESVFAWPGMGRLFFDALGDGDFPVVMGWLLVTAVFVVLLNIVVDVAYKLLDPRIRLG